jgi:hypothetical protein
MMHKNITASSQPALWTTPNAENPHQPWYWKSFGQNIASASKTVTFSAGKVTNHVKLADNDFVIVTRKQQGENGVPSSGANLR